MCADTGNSPCASTSSRDPGRGHQAQPSLHPWVRHTLDAAPMVQVTSGAHVVTINAADNGPWKLAERAAGRDPYHRTSTRTARSPAQPPLMLNGRLAPKSLLRLLWRRALQLPALRR